MQKINDDGDVLGRGASLGENSIEWAHRIYVQSALDVWNSDNADVGGLGWGNEALDFGQFAGGGVVHHSETPGGGAPTHTVEAADGPPPSNSSGVSNAPTSTSVAAGGTVEIAGPGTTTVVFAGSTGTLVIDESLGFHAQVAGLSGSDTIDLADLPFNLATEATFLGNESGGTLTITNGAETAKIALTGNYLSSTWTVSSDGNGGTDVVDPTVSTNWQMMKVGAGGNLTGMDIDPDGTMVVRTDTNGAFLWNGTSWQQLVTSSSMPAAFLAANPAGSGQGVYEIQMAPSNSSIMYMSFDGSLFVSTNKGTTWTQTSLVEGAQNSNGNFAANGQKLAVDPNNPNIVYVGTQTNGLFVTINGGKTWSQVSAVPVSGTSGGGYPGISGILFDPAIGGVVGGVTQTIFASSYGNGVYESTNGGTTWSQLSGGPSDVEYAAVSSTGVYYAVGDSGSGLWRYSNGTWAEVLVQGMQAVAINPLNPNEIVTVTGGDSLNISYNAGATWSGLYASSGVTSADIPWLAAGNSSPGGNWLDVNAIAFSETTPNELIAGAGTGAWNVTIPTSMSSSTRFTWNDMSLGIENLVANEILVAPGGVPVLASWDRPFFYISNLNAYPSTYGPVASDNIVAGWSLDYASSTPSFLVGLADWWGYEESGYSTNGGQTWTNFATDIPGAASQFMGGTIAASTPQNIIWAPADGFDPYYTLNGGQTWNAITLPGVTSWAGFDGAYYYDMRSVTADRVLANTFYLYFNGVYETTNGGQTWVKQSGAVNPQAVVSEIMSVPGEAGNLFFTGGALSSVVNPAFNTAFYMSTNQGATWTTVPNVLDVFTFGFGAAAPGQNYPAIYIVGDVNGVYGVWQSINKGASWTQIGTQPAGELDQITTISGDPNVYGQVYVGFSGGGYAYLSATATVPSVMGVTASPPTGLEIPGSTIVFTMNFSSAVTVSGTPTLSLSDGGTATYTGGSGTSALTFSNTVSTSDQDVANLAITAVNLPSGATISSGGTTAVLTGAIQSFPGLAVDPPILKAIGESPSTGDLGAGKTITFTLTMGETVTVSGGTPTLTLNDNGVATYSGGSGTSALTFTYTVASGQNTSGLAVTAVNLGGATIVNGVGAEAGLSLTGLSQSGPQIDTTGPTVTITSLGGTVSSATQTISGTVDAADAGLAVSLFDGTTQIGTATSNSTTGAWSATVTLASGLNSITASTVDGAGNSATSSAVVYAVGVTSPLLTEISESPSTGDLDAGKTVTITLTFSQAVTVSGGTPTLTLNDGGVAKYSAGSGTSALAFTYTVASGQNTTSLAIVSSSLNGATIVNSVGTEASLSATGLSQSGPRIDTAGPTVAITSVGGNVSSATQTIAGSLDTADPGLVVTLYDGTTKIGTATSNSTTGAWSANVTLGSGVNSITASTVDGAGNPATSSAVVYDVISGSPLLTGITESPSTGDLDAGKTVTITLTFSQAVIVSGGTPTMTLNDGGVATYSGGSGTNALNFTYAVAAGQNTSSLAIVSGSLNGASIVNTLGTSAGVTLTSIPQSGPRIDTTAPTVSITSLGGTVSSATQTISGTVDAADAGLAVAVSDGTKQIATVNSNSTTGAWSAPVTLSSGANSITAKATDGAGNSTTSGAVVYNWNASMSVATYLANRTLADQQAGGVNIVDTAANVAANIDALAGDTHIVSITLSDNGILTLTAAQALNDTAAISIITPDPAITVADTAANLSLLAPAQIAALSAEGVTLVDATDQIPILTKAEKSAIGAGGILLQQTATTGVVELLTYNSAGTVSSITYSDVTGAAYNSYTVNYNTNMQIVSASYSNGMAKTWTYNSDGSYTIATTGITGLTYNYDTMNYSASKQILSASYSNGVVESFNYNSNGSYTIAVTGVTGTPYTSYTINYGANGNPISASYGDGMTRSWSYNSDGSYQSTTANMPGGSYSSYEYLYGISGSAFAISEQLTNNSDYAVLYGDDVITNVGADKFSINNGTDSFNLTSFDAQTISANGENSETFEFTNNFGHDIIKGLVPSGATQDVIQFSTSMFSYLTSSMSQTADANALLSHAQQVGTGVTITDSAADTLTLANTTIATLTANPSVFHFV